MCVNDILYIINRFYCAFTTTLSNDNQYTEHSHYTVFTEKTPQTDSYLLIPFLHYNYNATFLWIYK